MPLYADGEGILGGHFKLYMKHFVLYFVHMFDAFRCEGHNGDYVRMSDIV